MTQGLARPLGPIREPALPPSGVSEHCSFFFFAVSISKDFLRKPLPISAICCLLLLGSAQNITGRGRPYAFIVLYLPERAFFGGYKGAPALCRSIMQAQHAKHDLPVRSHLGPWPTGQL